VIGRFPFLRKLNKGLPRRVDFQINYPIRRYAFLTAKEEL